MQGAAGSLRDYIGEDTEPPTGNPKTSPQP
jgi:hypothetical protein